MTFVYQNQTKAVHHLHPSSLQRFTIFSMIIHATLQEVSASAHDNIGIIVALAKREECMQCVGSVAEIIERFCNSKADDIIRSAAFKYYVPTVPSFIMNRLISKLAATNRDQRKLTTWQSFRKTQRKFEMLYSSCS